METKTHLTKKRNKVVALPSIRQYVIQPNRITNSVYDYSLVQEKLFNAVMFYLQDAIKLSIKGENYTQLELWKNAPKPGFINILIPLNEITIPQHYSYVKEALKELAKIVVEVPYFNERTKSNWIHITGLLEANIPLENDYSSHIEVSIKNEVAKFLIEIEKNTNGDPIQYTRFLYQVAQASKNKYTSRIYKLISSYKKKGGFVIPIDDFRKWCCIGNKYQDYKDIKKRILMPAQDDLFEKADCWFNCKSRDFVVRTGKKVTHLNFKIITPDLIEEDKSKKDYVLSLLRMHFKFEDKHINQVLPIFNFNDPNEIIRKVTELNTYYHNNSTKIADIASYAVSSLLTKFSSAKINND